MQEKIYHHGLRDKVLTRAEQDEMFRELNRMQQDRMRHFAELLANEPRLAPQFSGHSMYNLSALEERVHLPVHTLFAEKGRDPDEQLSGTMRCMGITRGVVHRYPRMSDNLPKGTIKIDASGMKNVRENMLVGYDYQRGEDLFRAMAFGLTMDQMGITEIDSVPKGADVIVDYKTVGGPTGRALRVNREPVWQSSQRDRAATSAPVRKKLRSKTRAQKKARRKQR